MGRFVFFGLALCLIATAVGCEKTPGALEKLEGKRLGLMVDVSDTDREYIELTLLSHLRKKLKSTEVISPRQVEAAAQASARDILSEAIPSAPLERLRSDLEMDYLLVVDIQSVDNSSTKSEIRLSTDKQASFEASQRCTLSLAYHVYDTSSGVEVLSGVDRGESTERVEFELGTEGTKLGIRVGDKQSLVGEALLDAIKNTGLL